MNKMPDGWMDNASPSLTMRASVHQKQKSSTAISAVLIRPAFPAIHMPKHGKTIASRKKR